jgi:hypothetical protein
VAAKLFPLAGSNRWLAVANGYVYLFYTWENTGNPNDPGPKTVRLTRVTADPATGNNVAIAGSFS